MGRFLGAALALMLSMGRAVPTPWGNISRALVVFAHPDDAETICGGMVATLVDYGVSVAYLVVTNGDKGWSKNYNMTSSRLTEIRREEQLAAAAVLNVSQVWFLDQEDGRTEGVDPVELKLNITIAIRTWQPDVLLTFDSLSDLTAYRFGVVHRDHQTVGRVAMDAAYPAARDYLSFAQLWPAYPTWDTPQVWVFSFQQVRQSQGVGPLRTCKEGSNSPGECSSNSGGSLYWVCPFPPPHPTQVAAGTGLVLDVSAVFDRKVAAMLEHRSQYDSASDVRTSLMQLGSAVSSRNNLDPSSPAEAYTVVTID